MDVNFDIVYPEKFAYALYNAAVVYTNHRFDSRVDGGYFSDALHYYYHSNEIEDDVAFVVNDDVNEIVYFRGKRSLSTKLGKYTLIISGPDIVEVSLEEFILELALNGNDTFPPMSKLTNFPRRRRDRIFYPFQQLKLLYPQDLKMISRLSYNLKFLRSWLHNDKVDKEVKMAFVFGYNSGIQKTLAAFIPMYASLKKYVDQLPGEVDESLLSLLREGRLVPGMKSSYGNYTISPKDFSSILNITSNAQFMNPVPEILPNEAIPEIRLPPLDTNRAIVLGEGGYGTVYSTPDDDKFVYKVFFDKESFESELVALSYLNRYMDNFTNLSQVICYDSQLLMFKMMKLMPLPRYANPFTSIDGNMPIFLQIVMGLYSMHSSGIAHNDIKFPNIMQTPDGNVQIIDFGLAAVYCDHMHELINGTYIYSPPEIFAGEDTIYLLEENEDEILTKHDIWSTCMVAYEMLLGRSIYSFLPNEYNSQSAVSELAIKLGNQNIYKLPRHQTTREALEKIPNLFNLIGDDKDLQDLLKSCLTENPFSRASAFDILTSNYAKRYIPNFIQSAIPPCRRRDIIDGNPFAGYRSKKERKNWICFCAHYGKIGVKYATYFEFPGLPKALTYADYIVIFSIAAKRDIHLDRLDWIQLPHPIPLTNGYGLVPTLEILIKKYEKLLSGVPKLQIFKDHSKADEIQKIVTRGYLDGKCKHMSVLELLAE